MTPLMDAFTCSPLPWPHWLADDGSVLLINGDCREVLPLLRAGAVDACVTDPPYGIGLDTDYSTISDSGRGVVGYGYLRKNHPPVIGDDKPFDPAPLLGFPECILFGVHRFWSKLPDTGSLLVWDKRAHNGHALLADGECAWHSRGTGVFIFSHCWHGFARASENSEHYHPTQKPVALLAWCLSRLRTEAHTILDPYAGSFPTPVACIQTGRRAICVELDAAYFALGVARCKQAIADTATFFGKPVQGELA